MPLHSFKVLDVTWTDWKVYAGRSNVTTYYVTGPASVSYEVLAIDPRFIYRSAVIVSSEVTDFVTNYLSGATSVAAIDDAVATANKLETIQNVQVDASNTVVAINAGVSLTSHSGLPAMASDGSNAVFLLADATGRQKVLVSDSAGNSLTSTGNKLDVGLTGANTVKLSDSAGTAITLSGANLKTSLFDVSGNAAVLSDNQVSPGSYGVVIVGGNDGANIRDIAVDTTGRQKVLIADTTGNSLTSTSNALDVNVKSQTTAIKVSKSTADNAVANPIFVELSDGTAAFGTSGNPFSVTLTGTSTVRIQDSSGNTLNSTSGDLNVSLRDSAGTAITLSGGNLKSSLFDSSGNAALLTDNQASPGSYGVVIVGGNDGANIRDLNVDTTGKLKVDLFDNAGNALNSTTNALNVSLRDGSGNAVTSLAGGNSSRLLDVIVRDIFGLVADHVFQFGTVTTTTTAANQTILTYTVPAGKDLLLTGLFIGKSATNNVDAVPFRFRVGGTDKMVYATDQAVAPVTWNPNWGFPVKIATAADVITVTVTPSAAASSIWNATLFGYLRSI